MPPQKYYAEYDELSKSYCVYKVGDAYRLHGRFSTMQEAQREVNSLNEPKPIKVYFNKYGNYTGFSGGR